MSLEGAVTPMPSGKYQRVLTHEGDWKSICLNCYLTAARASSEDALEHEEQKHVCSYTVGVSPNSNRPAA